MSEEAVATSTTSEAVESTGAEGASTLLAGGEGVAQQAYGNQFDYSQMPDGLAHEPSLQNFDTVDKLAKSYVNLVKKMGVPAEQLVRLPEAGQPMDDVYNALGRPESANHYNLENYAPEQTEYFRGLAHQLGLNNQQAQALFDAHQQTIDGMQNQDAEAFEQFEVENLKALQAEWGDNFNSNLELARRAFMNFATPEAVEVLEKTGLGNHPEILKLFSQVGSILQEDSILPGSSQAVLGGMNPATAQEAMNSKLSDQEFRTAYLDQYHPNHASAVREMTKLHEYIG